MRHCWGRAAVVLVLACAVGCAALVANADVSTSPDPLAAGNDNAPDELLEEVNTFGYWRTDKGPLKLSVIGGKSILRYPGFDHGMIAYVMRGNEYFALDGDNGKGECDSGGDWARVLLEPAFPDRFIGSARICEESTYRTESWSGVLIAGSAWFSPDLYMDESVRRPQLDMSENQSRDLMKGAHGNQFDPANARSLVLDMTCDGGLDQVHLWNGRDGGLRLSVAHNQRPLFEGEETGSVETISLGTVDHTGRGCPTKSADEFQVEELDTVLRGLTGAPSYLPTCSQILVGPGTRCRIYWDFLTETFGMY